jgi:hypothetical protein
LDLFVVLFWVVGGFGLGGGVGGAAAASGVALSRLEEIW